MVVYIDDHELAMLEVDLTAAPGRLQRNMREGIIKGARRTAKEMRVDATDHPGNWFGRPGTSFDTGLERHVSYQLITDQLAEIGIEAKGSGLLGKIIAMGSVNNPPAYDYTAGPNRALPGIVNDFADLAERSVLGDRA